MATQLAQTTVPESGASSAVDFQPLTQNPQTAPVELFQGSGDLQAPGTDVLLQNSNSSISLPPNTTTETAEVTEARSGSFGVIIALAVAVVLILLIRRWYRRTKASPNTGAPAVSEPAEAAETVPLPEKPAAAKPKQTATNKPKTPAKHKKNKRNKRKHR